MSPTHATCLVQYCKDPAFPLCPLSKKTLVHTLALTAAIFSSLTFHWFHSILLLVVSTLPPKSFTSLRAATMSLPSPPAPNPSNYTYCYTHALRFSSPRMILNHQMSSSNAFTLSPLPQPWKCPLLFLSNVSSQVSFNLFLKQTFSKKPCTDHSTCCN